jgi:multidrug efflux system outer membrane protein
MKRIAIIFLCSCLAACMVGPDYERPQMPETDHWHSDTKYGGEEGQALNDVLWSDIFKDEELRDLILVALEENKDLLIAIERLEEARAISGISKAALYPQLGFALTAEREKESALTNTNPITADETFFGPVASWEIDLWGGNRRASRADFSRYLAAEYGAQAVRLSLIADVSTAYFDLQATEAFLEISHSTLDARQQALTIAEKRHRGGLTSKLEVIQSEVDVASTRADIPKVEQAKLEVENRLAVLLGKTPRHYELERRLRDQYVPASVTAGLPSSLMERRPDIMQAEYNLIAASEEVGVATARRFPNIRLTGGLGYQTDDFGDLLDSGGDFWIANLDIVLPLFDAGARKAGVSAAESRFNQSRLAYERSVLNAFREVSDSLNQFYKAGETLDAVLDLERASTEYLSLASKRYRNGVLAYIDVLDASRSLFGAQLSASQARQSQLLALVDLYKALGGGWDPEAIAALAENN